MRAPKNVRLLLNDGEVVPVECVFVGITDDGVAMWEVVTEIELSRCHRFLIDELPAMTGVQLPIREADGG